ncbi:MAG: cytochrome c [Planctomycetes bacterium]|nr:cytochrome c [Planctomycetota bacterium]
MSLMTPASPRHRIAQLLLAAALFGACQQTSGHAPQTASVAPPALDAAKPAALPGLHNVVAYAPGLISGGVPEGEEGLHTLAAMGIKTVISVDGATPDVATAEKLGIRYVHLPISYDTVTPERQQQLAQAISSLPGPVYMHCHHGKHRSAAALGSASVLAGKLTPEQACSRMEVSGTSASYKGLWKAVREAKPMDAGQLHADPQGFPSISKVSGMVATMSEIDLVWDLVKQAKAAGWKAPADHPDLVATKEASRLARLFANLQQDADSVKLPADYQTQLRHSIDLTAQLDAAVAGGNAAKAAELMTAIEKGCKDCHKGYRDN